MKHFKKRLVAVDEMCCWVFCLFVLLYPTENKRYMKCFMELTKLC